MPRWEPVHPVKLPVRWRDRLPRQVRRNRMRYVESSSPGTRQHSSRMRTDRQSGLFKGTGKGEEGSRVHSPDILPLGYPPPILYHTPRYHTHSWIPYPTPRKGHGTRDQGPGRDLAPEIPYPPPLFHVENDTHL